MKFVEFVGRFHPLLVHLPIGILVLAVAFEWISQREKFKVLQSSVPFMLLAGAVTALLSCITGYLLSQNGEYDGATVSWHQWLGISLMSVSFGYWWMKLKGIKPVISKILASLVVILLSITGHLGGSLTHGEGYLTKGLSTAPIVNFSEINLSEAKFYPDMVQPILQANCYTCHSNSKQKGKLRLDAPGYILTGGKHGAVLVANKVDESEMIERLLLPLNDDEHMPPKEKSQLTSIEIEILKSWIASGADFEKTITQTGQLNRIQNLLTDVALSEVPDVPIDEIERADEPTITKLKKMDVQATPVAQGSNYLSINLINAHPIDSSLSALGSLKDQIVWLKAGSTTIKDDDLKHLAKLKQLTRLSLDNTTLTGKGFANLKTLTNLQSINLSSTQVNTAALSELAGLPNLRTLYLYNSNIKTTDVAKLNKDFPSVKIEIGGYQLPLISTDTIVVKERKK